MLRFIAKRRFNSLDYAAIAAAVSINDAGHFWVGLGVILICTVISGEIEAFAKARAARDA